MGIKVIGSQQIFGSKPFWDQKIFDPKKLLSQNKFGSGENFGSKNYWVQIFDPKHVLKLGLKFFGPN